jgi:hypothetical protein
VDKILYFLSTTTGLPHAHILICLAPEDKPRNADHLVTLNLKKLSNANKASFIIEIEKLCQLYNIELNSTISRSKSQMTSASSEIVFDEFEDVEYSEIETV